MGPAPRVHASAPGKVILFGEHAVVYGEPSLSLALNRRVRVSAEPSPDRTTVNDQPLDAARHAYIHHALRLHWRGGPLHIRTESDVPSASGMGSSAALSVATVGALLGLAAHARPDPAAVARGAFATEFETQGAASPNDTTVSTAGGAVLLSPTPLDRGDRLWRIERDGRVWNAHRVRVPKLPLVVAFSGVRSRTADQVARVRRAVERSARARDALRAIGRLTLEGLEALALGDLARAGALMDANHEHLHALGVDAPALARLVEAARRVPGTLGAKLTGAGGGGSILVLTQRPHDVRAALEGLGAQAFLVESSLRGLEVDA